MRGGASGRSKEGTLPQERACIRLGIRDSIRAQQVRNLNRIRSCGSDTAWNSPASVEMIEFHRSVRIRPRTKGADRTPLRQASTSPPRSCTGRHLLFLEDFELLSFGVVLEAERRTRCWSVGSLRLECLKEVLP